jgi:NAD(P)H dehydrogenase (quinone)
VRVLVVYAHPLETSFIAALHLRAVETLRGGGHSVDDLDLYAERFDPVMSREQFAHYVDANMNAREVESYVKRLRAAEALVLVFPVWFDGLPAMMQGYFQRVFLPGVALRIDENGLFHPNLHNLKRMAAVCTYGEDERAVAAKNNPAHRFVHYNIGALIDPDAPFEYLAHYDMNFTSAPRRAAFMKRVTSAFEAW